MTTDPLCDASRYDKRLAIVIAYRDRAADLSVLVPHLVTCFQRDKLDRKIAVTLHVVEQNRRLGEDPETFFGGVVLFEKARIVPRRD